jgi:hypothetical protein
MSDPETPTFRIIPRKGVALLYTAFALFFVANVLSIVLHTGRVTMNGHQADPGEMFLILPVFFVLPIGLIIWYGRRLLPNSPFDFLELGADGLTIGGLLGQRHLAWENIAGFSVGDVPLTRTPTTWIKVEPRDGNANSARFFLGGYVKFAFFSRMKTRVKVIADWLDQVRAAYTFDNGLQELPPPPEELAAKIVLLSPVKPAHAISANRSSVIVWR